MLIVLAAIAIVAAVLLLRAGRRIAGTLLGVAGILVAAAAIALALFASAYRVPTESMMPTIELGDRVVAVDVGRPAVGEIVVLHPPESAVATGECASPPPRRAMCAEPGRRAAGIKLIKRVVARGGDRIALRGGRVVRNGRPAEEPWAKPCGRECRFPAQITVPAGHVFVLGDNRAASDDSRFWGPIPEDWVLGRVVVRYWPLSRAGSL